MTEKQKEKYDFYTYIGMTASQELNDLKDELCSPDISFERYDEIQQRIERVKNRIKWASHKRENVRNAKNRYEEYLRKAAEIKEEYGL